MAQLIGGAQTFGDPTLSETERVRHGEALRERASYRTGQRVPAAVVVTGRDPLRIELVTGDAVIEQVAAAVRRAQVAALDQHPSRAERMQGLGRRPLRRGIDDV